MMHINKKPLIHSNDRPPATAVDTIVIHSIYAKDHADSLSLSACFNVLDTCQVSAHYLISRDGEIWNLVDEDKRAWHAGVSKMPFGDDCRENVNHFSIGIELICEENTDFSSEQYEALALLTSEILNRHPITNIVGHEHIAPGRKVDPGPRFDWPRYRALVEGGISAGRTVRFPL
ncbi:MAG: N-acetylmuramoyl-L-alanine amidase [Deltaproteobacteria bacterium]|nr:N-acetylmuramoyl-L-alanine amidase [Deltaproteobacteria bacterium]